MRELANLRMEAPDTPFPKHPDLRVAASGTVLKGEDIWVSEE